MLDLGRLDANEGDRPYLTEVGPEVIATYVRIASAVIPTLTIPYGCGVLLILKQLLPWLMPFVRKSVTRMKELNRTRNLHTRSMCI